jgi:hypothetical protein
MEEDSTPLQLILKHLELLGYRTQVDAVGVQVTHDVQPFFRVFNQGGGIGFLFPFVTSKDAAQDAGGFFGFLNDMNAQSAIARFTFDRQRTLLWVSAWYPGLYERQSFGAFFDTLRQEIAASRSLFPKEVQKYLTP